MSTLMIRRLEFDAGHRVLGHQGRCRYLHGHRYTVEIGITAEVLNDLGMVEDFSVVKEKVGGWIDENLDHNMILNPHDPLLEMQIRRMNQLGKDVLIGRSPYIMPSTFPNPTAENIARLIGEAATNILHQERSLAVRQVQVYETPNCSAIWTPE